jgi:ribonuclease HII
VVELLDSSSKIACLWYSFVITMACNLDFETQHRSAGLHVIIGVDEAGRGPLAGPVVAGAAWLPADFTHETLTDSKKLSAVKRTKIYLELKADDRLQLATGIATVEEIDRLNILRATHLAMERAVRALGLVPEMVLIDGLPVRAFPFPQQALVGGDALSLSIAAASIIAKVERDLMMVAYDTEFPGYGFAQHKGYGTQAHLGALQTLGPCAIHRYSFAPVAQMNLAL